MSDTVESALGSVVTTGIFSPLLDVAAAAAGVVGGVVAAHA